MIDRAGSSTQRAVALCGAVLIAVSMGFAQAPPGAPQGPTGAQQGAPPLMSPDQLDNLVAPVALYPDPLLSQVLAASTYPLEVVEAQQWLALNANLQGAQLMDAARVQNWDPSVQALVAFPDALKLLNSDIRWTTDLGNAFLAQQSDVMNAVQAMRARAQSNGRLETTPQQVVTTDIQDNQSAIEIMPADPQVVYVPTYNPAYVWGPPVWGAYPDLWYPDGFGFGFGYGPGIYMGSFFPGWGGWGGWGWGCGWFGNGLFVNSGFFNQYGFRGGFGGGFGGRFGSRGFGGRGAWAHDPGHRMGVPYPNRTVSGRFNSSRFVGNGANGRQAGGGFNGRQAGGQGNRQFSNISRSNSAPVVGGRSNNASQVGGQPNRGAASSQTNGGWRSFNGNNGATTNGSAGVSRQASPNVSRGNYQSGGQYNRASGAAQSFRGQQSYNRSSAPAYSGSRGQNSSAQRFNAAPSRSFSAPTRSYSAPNRSSSAPAYSGSRGQNFSAQRFNAAPSRSSSAPTRSFSAPRSSGGGGFSGGHSGFSGGGHAGGGGGHSGGGGGHGGGGRR
jgi:hypothetical protein